MHIEYDVNQSIYDLKAFSGSGSTDIEMAEEAKVEKLPGKRPVRKNRWPMKRYSLDLDDATSPEDGNSLSNSIDRTMPSEPLVSMENIFIDKSEFEEKVEHERRKANLRTSFDDDIVEIAVSESSASVASYEEPAVFKRLGARSSFKLTLSSFNTSFILPPSKSGPYKTESKLLNPQCSMADQVAAEIGMLYYDASQCNSQEALKRLKDYVSLGYHSAEGFLMRIYALGQCGVEKDYVRARTIGLRLYPLLRSIAESGEGIRSIYAWYHIAVCHSEGLGVKQDHEAAIPFYKESADKGYTGAQAYLGYCYYHGIGVQQNQPEAVKWYRLAADQGHCASQFNLGVCYEQGNGADKNMDLSVRYYRMAADQRNPAAQYNLGRCYEKGDGVMQNFHKAAEWYTESANQGYTMAEYALGCCYLSGFGVEKDASRGVELIAKSAEKNYDLALVKLGLCYEEGNGIKKSAAMAIQQYYKAAELGNASALYRVGHFLYHGKAVQKDLAKAVYFFQLSAQREHRAAQIHLGICYQTGQGVKKDPDMAFKLFKMAANAGITEGQFQVARCYETGLGVNVNMREAIKYYKIAERKGNAEAHQALERLRGTIDSLFI